MPRDIYLVSYPSAPFKDHWAIFVPSAQRSDFGTLIQVEGDVRNGFRHGFRRNYNSKLSTRHPKLILLGRVADQHVHATPSTGALISENIVPVDNVEQAAFSEPPPGPSMNPTRGRGNGVSRTI